MIYEFLDGKGRTVEVDLPMGEAPDFGETMKHKGRTLTRALPSRAPQAKVQPSGRFKAWSLPPNWPYAKRHDTDGQPLFDTHKEREDALAKANDHGENLAYD